MGNATLYVNGEKIIHHYIREYQPKNRGDQDNFSKKVLRFKNGYNDDLRIFTDVLVHIISKENLEFDIIIPIPRSTEGLIRQSSKNLVENLSKKFDVENGTGILRRIESVPSSHLNTGQNRPTEQQHYNSINCEESLTGRKILLFDDILTSSDTARGCIRNIFDKGDSEITLITLAKTAPL